MKIFIIKRTIWDNEPNESDIMGSYSTYDAAKNEIIKHIKDVDYKTDKYTRCFFDIYEIELDSNMQYFEPIETIKA